MNGTFYVVSVKDKGFLRLADNTIVEDVLKASWLKNEEYATKVAFNFNKIKPGTIFKIIEVTVDSYYDYFTFEDKNDINSQYTVDIEDYEEDSEEDF